MPSHCTRTLLSALMVTAGCALASDPLPAPEEVLLVVGQTQGTLTVIPVTGTSGTTVDLGGGSPAFVVGRDRWALVPLDSNDAVAVVDLRSRTLARTIQLAVGSHPAAATFVDDSIAYVANPGLNTVTRVDYLTGDTASVLVGRRPSGVMFTRGRVFVANANSIGDSVVGPSWLSVVDPVSNTLAGGTDSIALPGPGGAGPMTIADDGVLYVMNAGPSDGTTEARLSLVDPVGRRELGNFPGFGNLPGPITASDGERVYVSSPSQGLMVFDLVKLRVLRGAGDGIPVTGNAGVAVDEAGRVYAVEPGACTPGAQGTVHVLRADYSEIRTFPIPDCAAGAAVTAVTPAS